MSTNPFRQTNRSSLKGSGGSSTPNVPSPDPRGINSTPLTVDTRVPSTSQKHVNFASPPAIPISPVSYPPSPESTRQDLSSPFPSPGATFTFPPPTDYVQALGTDPFAQEASDGEDDAVIGVALENARVNTTITVSTTTPSQVSKEDAVRETLSRFASGPRRAPGGQPSSVKEQSGSAKPTMDVDAFKRLLLTGERGAPSSVALARDVMVQGGHPVPIQPVSDSGSSADTASISQHSIFEAVALPPDGSPRTSDDLDVHEANEQRVGFRAAPQSKKKPAPPKSRRGKPLIESGGEQGPTATFDHFIDSLTSRESRHISSENSRPIPPGADGSPTNENVTTAGGVEAHKRVPPPPPLARRKSHHAPGKPDLTRSSSAGHSVLTDGDTPSSPLSISSTHKLPPLPPARRSTHTGERRPSLDVAHGTPTTESASIHHAPYHGVTASPQPSPSLSDTIPPYTNRLSEAHPPPVPPPRRARGSSRSSVETQRPSMTALGLREQRGSNASTRRISTDPNDILADLAALQREVDAARASAEGG
ncbi:hypothetical protein A1O1_03064 [Capronia coronata CBS 617.96]|uniref:Uncharacterized protein n=1 Tax=Capronia coronata CBS 617.96 TaxID=1182541 RepID=W9YP00_9EURO|nr:uncharacterized protein A1O1_03064 [Capronia coronata CBS 617.96]EXJ94667.1 hypothetical protein A1O1_03064 [Capronia coronata CBS 617.96]